MSDKEQEFTEREGFPDFSGFGEHPEDLRGMSPIIMPDGASFMPGIEADILGPVDGGGASRPFIQPQPAGLNTRTGVSYLPRSNFESYRSQRFNAWATALVPVANPQVWTPLLIDSSTITASTPVRSTSGIMTIPGAFGAVITGFRQWIGDANAYQKPNGEPDDIQWRLETAGSTCVDLSSQTTGSSGNIRVVISGSAEPSKLYIVVTEGFSIQLSVMNNITSTSNAARSIPVQGCISGYMFPLDELDDVFRNQ